MASDLWADWQAVQASCTTNVETLLIGQVDIAAYDLQTVARAVLLAQRAMERG
jgi:hypothetical protein